MTRHRPRTSHLALAAGVSAAAGLALSLTPPRSVQAETESPSERTRASASRQSTSAEKKSADRRLREGSRIENSIGFFRRNGDVATLVTEDGLELGGLPNLNLERVVKMLKTVDEPESVFWSVSGTVTEFSGRNYLLISRAVFKTAAPPPAPDAIEP